jgi:hypothetical protein
LSGIHFERIDIDRTLSSIIDRQAYDVLARRQTSVNGQARLVGDLLSLEIQVGPALVIGGQPGDIVAVQSHEKPPLVRTHAGQEVY